jgi:hypothetical protein
MKNGLLALAVTGALMAGCGRFSSHVRADDAALGRVVVYRNGVAYYERLARVDKDQLTIQVPRDKVDDFLKTLTVLDVATGEPLPASFARHRSSDPDVIDMTIQLPEGASDVVLTYVTAAPAWKPSYRVVVGGDGRVLLQGWAIVDNTSGEDWKEVIVGVGSSSALSFRYDLWSVRDVHRVELAGEDRFAVAPPVGVSPHAETGGPAVLTQVDADDIAGDAYGVSFSGSTSIENSYVVDGVNTTGESIVIDERAPTIDPTSGMSQGVTISQDHTRNVPMGRTFGSAIEEANEPAESDEDRRARLSEERERRERAVRLAAQQIRSQPNVVVLEGYASSSEGNPQQRSVERANALRNQLIEHGVPPAQVRVEGRGAVPGQPAGVQVVATGEVLPVDPAALAAADTPVGESHFQSRAPMTVARGSSVMVSVVKAETDGEVVYLYDPDTARGDQRYAFKAVRFVNPTDSTLETGPVTVYGDGSFIGEGLAEPIPPGATAVVPFALDRQVIVHRSADSRDRIASLVALERGLVTAEVQHLRSTRLALTNRLRRPVRVFVRHTVQKGWQLAEAPALVERIGSSYLFQVELAPGESRTVAIEEATPMTRTIDLHSRAGLDLVAVHLEDAGGDPALAAAVDRLLGLQRGMADTAGGITSWHERLAEYRVRMDELRAQIVTLKEAKAGGRLLRHLEAKLQEISERVQRATIELVGLEEQLMLGRIEYQDAVSELGLTDRLATSN